MTGMSYSQPQLAVQKGANKRQKIIVTGFKEIISEASVLNREPCLEQANRKAMRLATGSALVCQRWTPEIVTISGPSPLQGSLCGHPLLFSSLTPVIS